MGNYFDAEKNKKLFEVLVGDYLIWKNNRDGAEATDCIEMVCDRRGISLTDYDELRNYAPVIQEIIDEANRLEKVAYGCRFETEGKTLNLLAMGLIQQMFHDKVIRYFDEAK